MIMKFAHPRLAPAVALTGGVLLAGACGGASRFEGLEAAEMYRLAQQEVEQDDLGDASETLDRLLLNYPEFDSAATASLMLGDVYFDDEKYITAAAQYSRFLSRWPAHPQVPRASFRICESYGELSRNSQRDQSETNQALTVCRNVARDFFGTEFADSAASIAGSMISKLAKRQYEIGWFYQQRRGYDAAVLYYEQLVQDYPDTEYAPRALFGIMESYEEIADRSPGLGYEQEIEIARERLLTQYPLSDEAEQIRAEMAERMGSEATDTTAAAGVGASGSRSIPGG